TVKAVNANYQILSALKLTPDIRRILPSFLSIVEGLVTVIELGILSLALNLVVVVRITTQSSRNNRRPEEENMECDQCIWYICVLTALCFILIISLIVVFSCIACCFYSFCSGKVIEEEENKEELCRLPNVD
ncbi:hypothetical protein PFISCL1PPCAC_26658, partial [Pristionchus fissidentatus]